MQGARKRNTELDGGFKHFLSSPLPGEMIQYDEHIFSNGWFNHQLVKNKHLIELCDQGAFIHSEFWSLV